MVLAIKLLFTVLATRLLFSRMIQLNNFQLEVIVLFIKKEHATWGLRKYREVLPVFFGEITTNQYRGIAAALKSITARVTCLFNELN